MTNLYLYLILFSLLLISSCIAFIFFNKKHRNSQKNLSQKIFLYSITSTLITSIFATLYCVTLFFNTDKKISSISRPNIGEGDSSISINIDSEIYSGTMDLEILEKQITFEEAIEIFSNYREELDKCILGNNTSFCEVISPLNFPSSIGSENIAISWHISNPDIIDYTGNILFDNMTSDSFDLEIIASLRLGEHTAEICYYITVIKVPPTAKDQLYEYIQNHINNSSLLTETNINLPSQMNGIDLSFYSKENSLPPIYFSSSNHYNAYTYFYT